MGRQKTEITTLTVQRDGLQKDLNRISEEKNNQATVTTRTIERVVRGDPKTHIVTKIIREAPVEKECKTPALQTLKDTL